MRKHFALAAAALLSLAVAGCTCTPVDDVRGTYTGTWRVGDNENDPGCNVTIALNESVEDGLTAEVTGVGTLNFSCITSGLPAPFNSAIQINEQTQALVGTYSALGTITLREPENFECPNATCLRVRLFGEGVDTDEDGEVNEIAGTWNLVIKVDGQDVSSPVTLGTFRVSRV